MAYNLRDVIRAPLTAGIPTRLHLPLDHTGDDRALAPKIIFQIFSYFKKMHQPSLLETIQTLLIFFCLWIGILQLYEKIKY